MAHSHHETHFRSTEILRDALIGMADGLTVPFALAAGLSSAAVDNGIIVTAGLAEIAAGSIAMGLGGYLAARTSAQHYDSEVKRELYEIEKFPEREAKEVSDILQAFGLEETEATKVTEAIRKDPKRWLDFMMRFELVLEKPEPRRAAISAATIGGAYIVGGLIPLLPYMLHTETSAALPISSVITGIALFLFGSVKGKLTGSGTLKSGIQTALIGGLAASAAFFVAKLF